MRKFIGAGIAAILCGIGMGSSSPITGIFGGHSEPLVTKNLPSAPEQNKTGEVNLLTNKRRDSARTVVSVNGRSQRTIRKRNRQKRAFM